ncbi:DUF4116 domain-containing protein [Acinetobacter sp. ANC 5380]|uniref:DUF4116 domain-containing protein n=1 Tax=Acinetobacter terrae TaxID=2731247 RepID=A0A7Y2WC05_9GAMM|nr:DUF4116 domain-containing protein [Acinetobacter terrae]NNH78829.1 DUF4116 domain-containing protein [Acinetobacter terrae]
MKETYQNIFLKINEIESQILNDLINGTVLIDDIPEILLTTKMILTGIVANKQTISSFPVQKLDQYSCLISCAFNENNLNLIPHIHYDWVKSNLSGEALKHVRPADQTEYICLKLIELDHVNINYVRSDLMTYDFMLMATALKPQIISELDIQVFSPDLISVALKSDQFDLGCLPDSWKTKEVCDQLFNKSYLELLNFPREFIEVNQIKTALKQCGSIEALSIFQLFEAGQYDDETIILAVEKNESCLKMIDDELITKDLILKLAPHIKRYETLVTPVIQNALDRELCLELINCNPMLLYGIPESMRELDLCLKAISLNGMSLGAVPISLADDELYKVAVQNNGLALCHVPTPYRDHEIPYIAIKENGEALEYVPDEFMNADLCRMAVEANPYAIYSVPKRLRSLDIFKLAIIEMPDVLKFMPQEMRGLEACRIALEKNKELIEYVPMEIRVRLEQDSLVA